jgi:hypothetical protein
MSMAFATSADGFTYVDRIFASFSPEQMRAGQEMMKELERQCNRAIPQDEGEGKEE